MVNFEEQRKLWGNKPWWHPDGGFFGDRYMEADDSFSSFHSGGDVLDTRTGREVSGVLDLIGLRPGDRVLDCPCGYGRHSVELARRGAEVTGVDINPRFLGLAERVAAGAEVNVDFVLGDMRRLPDIEPVDAVINMFYSFGFFTPAEDVDVLRGFHRVLKPGGRFLMHTFATVPAYRDGRIPQEERRTLRSGNTLLSWREFDPETRREVGQMTIVDADGVERPMAPYDVRIYETEEFMELCRETGFTDVVAFGDWDGQPYQDASPYLITVATK